ncbi:MAG: hypothetical protein ACFUZC_14580 [Chthoniobacteraceae bacterium]
MPKPPYVAPLPQNGHWTITLNSVAQTDKERVPATIDTIKTGETKQVTLLYKDGTSQRFNHAGGYIFTQSSKGVEIFTKLPGIPAYPCYTDGFVFVENIGPAVFKDMAKISGTECFHYQTGSSDVWIAVDSMLPVAARSGNLTAYYQFQPPPTAPIALPPEEAAILRKWEKAYNAFGAMR